MIEHECLGLKRRISSFKACIHRVERMHRVVTKQFMEPCSLPIVVEKMSDSGNLVVELTAQSALPALKVNNLSMHNQEE